LHNNGIDELRDIIYSLIRGEGPVEIEDVVVPNLRQKGLLEKSLEAVRSVVGAIQSATPVDCVTIDLDEAVMLLGNILGVNAKEDILDRIFSQFCIGK
jgi:tRNA modification GTPase